MSTMQRRALTASSDGQEQNAGEACEGHVVTAPERRLAVEHWLLSATRDRARARADWERDGMTYLSCGTLLTAVRIPGLFVHAAAQSNAPGEVDAFLAQALEGGPVIASVGLSRYYVLVPPIAAMKRLGHDTECLPAGHELGVPPLTLATYQEGVSYWAVPPDSAGDLCDVDLAEKLARYGQLKWSER